MLRFYAKTVENLRLRIHALPEPAVLQLRFQSDSQYCGQQLADTYYNLEPQKASLYLAITALPYAFNLFYGIFCDSIPLFGSRKRNYIILMGFFQFALLAPGFIPIPNV